MIPRRSLLALAALALGLTADQAQAQVNMLPTTREVREVWKVVVSNPDPAGNGPQIMTYMSAVSDTSDPYVWFMLNVRDNPNPYSAGGLMFQIWDYSDSLVASSTSTTDTAQLNTANETITWTQRLYFNANKGQLTYEILNGSSTTWGTFGSSNGLSPVIYKTSISSSQNLSLYSPSVSVAKSRVAWQPNNVTSMTLVQVRQYDAKGTLIQTDDVNLPVNLSSQ